MRDNFKLLYDKVEKLEKKYEEMSVCNGKENTKEEKEKVNGAEAAQKKSAVKIIKSDNIMQDNDEIEVSTQNHLAMCQEMQKVVEGLIMCAHTGKGKLTKGSVHQALTGILRTGSAKENSV